MRLRSNQKAVLQLKTDTATFDRIGKTIAEKNSAAVGVEVELSVTDAVFKALQNSVRLTLDYKNRQTTFPISMADIAGMIDLCSKPATTK